MWFVYVISWENAYAISHWVFFGQKWVISTKYWRQKIRNFLLTVTWRHTGDPEQKFVIMFQTFGHLCFSVAKLKANKTGLKLKIRLPTKGTSIVHFLVMGMQRKRARRSRLKFNIKAKKQSHTLKHTSIYTCGRNCFLGSQWVHRRHPYKVQQFIVLSSAIMCPFLKQAAQSFMFTQQAICPSTNHLFFKPAFVSTYKKITH